jgi:hypothetical protein
MAYGGTNFAFLNGANVNPVPSTPVTQAYLPQVTSYDYNAPLAEDGRHGVDGAGVDKYAAVRTYVQSLGKDVPAEPAYAKPVKFSDVDLTPLADETGGFMSIRGHLSAGDQRCQSVKNSLEDGALAVILNDFDVYDHMALLRYYVAGQPATRRWISFVLSDVKDRVYIYNETSLLSFVDRQGIHGETNNEHSVEIDMSGSAYFDLLIENNGRQNFSPRMLEDKKGLKISKFKIDGSAPAASEPFILCRELVQDSLVPWRPPAERLRGTFPHWRGADATQPEVIQGDALHQQYPVSYQGFLTIDESTYKGKNTANSSFPPDTHIDLSALIPSKGSRKFGKGILAVNGHVLGRYWSSLGPQYSLYCPGAFLKFGRNVISLLELEKYSTGLSAMKSITLSFSADPIYPLWRKKHHPGLQEQEVLLI